VPTRRFRPRLIPTLATAAGLAVLIHLGLWQHGKAVASEFAAARHLQRSTLPPEPVGASLLDPQHADAARYSVRGQYEPERQFFIDNRQEGDVAGVHVVTPLRIDGSDTRILVNRGWIGWPHGRRGELPQVPVPDGHVQVTGTAQVPSTKPFFLMPDRPDPQPRLWNRIDLARLAAQLGHPVQPVVLLQDGGDLPDGLVRHWPAPEDRSLKHRSYAMQWFAMAAALLVFWFVASLRRRATPTRQEELQLR
jgi:surfeit locus 1 family protein